MAHGIPGGALMGSLGTHGPLRTHGPLGPWAPLPGGGAVYNRLVLDPRDIIFPCVFAMPMWKTLLFLVSCFIFLLQSRLGLSPGGWWLIIIPHWGMIVIPHWGMIAPREARRSPRGGPGTPGIDSRAPDFFLEILENFYFWLKIRSKPCKIAQNLLKTILNDAKVIENDWKASKMMQKTL